MKKEGFRLPTTSRLYDPDGAAAMRDELEAIVVRLLPAKNLRDGMRDAVETNGQFADAELDAAEAVALTAHDVAQQILTDAAIAARAAWGLLAHAAQIQAGPQPALHVVAPFVPPARQLRVREARINVLRDASVVEQIIMLFGTGASIAELYEAAPNNLASIKVANGHRAALLASAVALRAAVQGRSAVQAHPLVAVIIVDTVLEYWRTHIQMYTADQVASADIAAIEATLERSITMAAAPDMLQHHCDAFGAVNVAGAVGFEERLVTSVLRSCEPPLRHHLDQTVPRDELVRQARAGTVLFVRFLVSQVRLAQAKAQAANTGSTVAALELVIAGLRADHGRLEQQVREQVQHRPATRQHQQRQQRQQRQGQQAPTGQRLGSPAYDGCNFTLPNGAKCGSKDHYARDHPV